MPVETNWCNCLWKKGVDPGEMGVIERGSEE